mgnify:CR=1 FL=1
MNLADLQAQVVRKLQAFTPLLGVTIIAHDGTDGFIESSKERTAALTSGSMGCCITVMPIISDGLIQSGVTGESSAVILSVGIGVAIEENVRICRSQGAGIPAETMLQHVFAAVLGPLEGDELFGSTIGLADPPFENLGNSKGVQAFIAAFSVPLTITPTS